MTRDSFLEKPRAITGPSDEGHSTQGEPASTDSIECSKISNRVDSKEGGRSPSRDGVISVYLVGSV
jgi:hypothetical protein